MTAKVMLFIVVQLLATLVHADPITYRVDFSGVDESTDHRLRVAGTIDADQTTNEILWSNLTFFHDTDAGQPLPPFPGFGGRPGTEFGFQWNATETALYFERTDTSGRDTFWNTPCGDRNTICGGIQFSVVNPHNLIFFNLANGPDEHVDEIILHPASGPDAPGFLVGTVVPEPSCLALIGPIVILLTSRRCPTQK